jgi:hypothetical protein
LEVGIGRLHGRKERSKVNFEEWIEVFLAQSRGKRHCRNMQRHKEDLYCMSGEVN